MNRKYNSDIAIAMTLFGFGLGVLIGLSVSPGPLGRLAVIISGAVIGAALGLWYSNYSHKGG